MKQYAITPGLNKAFFWAVFVALGIIARRALFAAQKAAKTAKIWLNNKHAFCRDNDNPAGIVLTGWQYIGFNAMAGLVLIIIAMIGD